MISRVDHVFFQNPREIMLLLIHNIHGKSNTVVKEGNSVQIAALPFLGIVTWKLHCY